MELLYLSRRDVEAAGVDMSEVLPAVDEGFRLKGLGKTEMPAKIGIHTSPDAFIHAMPAYVRGVEAAGMKWVSGYPSNPSRGLPYITGLLILNDAQTGLPLAVMDCSWITAMRTGASAGVSAKYLADPKSRIVGILGCGVQNRAALQALVRVLPGLAEVRCRDIVPSASERYIAEMSQLFPKLCFRTVGTDREMIDEADVVVTAVPIVRSPQPALDDGMLKPGGLAIALDYDSAWTPGAMRQCRFFSDDVEQLLETRKHGAYFAGIPDRVDGDLGELAAGLKPGRSGSGERYFSMNMGIAVDDMVTAPLVYRAAIAKGIGVRLPL